MATKARSNGKSSPRSGGATPAVQAEPQETQRMAPGIQINWERVVSKMQTRIGSLIFEVSALESLLEESQAQTAQLREVIDQMAAKMPSNTKEGETVE